MTSQAKVSVPGVTGAAGVTGGVPDAIGRLLEDIHLHVPTNVFQCHLEKCPRSLLETWCDVHGFDLLHHAVLENNALVVVSLFALGIFKPPLEPRCCWSYLHVAAVLGQRAIVSMLLQERPYDNKKQLLDWSLFHSVIAPKLDVSKVTTSIVPATEKEKQFAFWPLDLAARYGHSACVKTILDFHMLHEGRDKKSRVCNWIGGGTYRQAGGRTGQLHMAVMLDSPYALRLLLTDSPEEDDVHSALDAALKTARPECVDTLLRYGIDRGRLFGGMNLFHVLYAYSKTFEDAWFESMVTVTSVLLRHGHDVNACRPSRTFPLYSLLRSMRIANMELSAPYIITTLLLLLQAGADPNFDEILIEVAVRDKELDTAFGRKAFSSALHCLVDAAVNLVEEVSDPQHVLKYVYKVTELLLTHGADPSYISTYVTLSDSDMSPRLSEGNVLHALCDVMPRLGHVDMSLLLLLLRHGANPDACVEDLYPLTAYWDSLIHHPHRSTLPPSSTLPSRQLTVQSGLPHPDSASHPQSTPTSLHQPVSANDVLESELVTDVRRMCRMAGFMSRNSQSRCVSFLRCKLAAKTEQQLPASVVPALRCALKDLENRTMCVPSLRRCCSMVAWRSCRRHVGNVYKLPIPRILVDVIIDHLT